MSIPEDKFLNQIKVLVPYGMRFFSFCLQQSHEVLMSIYKDLKEGTFVPNATSSSWKTSKEQEKELINRLLEIFSKVNPGSLKSRVSFVA